MVVASFDDFNQPFFSLYLINYACVNCIFCGSYLHIVFKRKKYQP